MNNFDGFSCSMVKGGFLYPGISKYETNEIVTDHARKSPKSPNKEQADKIRIFVGDLVKHSDNIFSSPLWNIEAEYSSIYGRSHILEKIEVCLNIYIQVIFLFQLEWIVLTGDLVSDPKGEYTGDGRICQFCQLWVKEVIDKEGCTLENGEGEDDNGEDGEDEGGTVQPKKKSKRRNYRWTVHEHQKNSCKNSPLYKVSHEPNKYRLKLCCRYSPLCKWNADGNLYILSCQYKFIFVGRNVVHPYLEYNHLKNRHDGQIQVCFTSLISNFHFSVTAHCRLLILSH